MAEDTKHVVVIEGTSWSLVDAGELARRVRRFEGESRDELRAEMSLAEAIEERIARGGGEPIDLTASQTTVAYAVLNEWRQFETSPEAVDTLYDRIAAP